MLPRYVRCTSCKIWIQYIFNAMFKSNEKMIGLSNPSFHSCKKFECLFHIVISDLCGKSPNENERALAMAALSTHLPDHALCVILCIALFEP